MKLDFIEVGQEEYDFAVPEKYLDLPYIQAFIQILKSEDFLIKLKELEGDVHGDGGKRQVLIFTEAQKKWMEAQDMEVF